MEDETESIEEELSPEEKLQIVQHLLLNSPPGQFKEVLSDVEVLAGPIESSMVEGIARAYNVANYKTVGDVLVCKEGEEDARHYVSSKSGEVYEVEHLAGSSTPAGETKPVDEECQSLLAAVEGYVSSRYNSAQCGVYRVDQGMTVVISGERLNLRNYYSGNWISVWTANKEEGIIDGSMKIRAHYFEDGNVQLQTNKKFESVPLPTPDDAGIVEVIQQSETELQSALEAMYLNMSDETFKAMRRIMPITRTKMKWNINEIALNRNLRK